ncbi:CDP-alcohol phosphatidyltransferase family protein [Patescibacteria group bacterium]|nr:CDP-alcohol phosphatidyltransferase family protein [Patescibacteria group bacterium]MBU0963699.1 CDP-alcohol phosphatidyltransferase family protein [Patescibacteria group bacterium]
MNGDTINNIFLGRIINGKEKMLRGIAKVIPPFITPNMITTLRALFIIPIYFAYQQEAYTWVFILFILALSTDTIDGIQARYHNKVTTLGKLLDPAADKILFIGLFLMLAPDRLSSAVIYTIIILELALVLLAAVLAPIMIRFFKYKLVPGANNAGKIKMNIEGLAIIILLFGINNPTIHLISEVCLWLAACFALLSIILHLSAKENKNTNSA